MNIKKIKNYKGYCGRTGSELMYGDLFNARPSDCPLVEIEERKVGKWQQTIPLDRIKQARKEIENIKPLDFLEITKQIGSNGQEMEISKKFAIAILDKLIAESEK